MALQEAISWLASAVVTTAVSGAGFYCLAVAADYVKNYYREQRQRDRERLSQEIMEIQSFHDWKEEMLGLPGGSDGVGMGGGGMGQLVPRQQPTNMSKGATVFSAYKMSPAFMSCTAKPRGRTRHRHSCHQLSDSTGGSSSNSSCSSCCCCCSSSQILLQRHLPLVAAARAYTWHSSTLEAFRPKISGSEEICTRCKSQIKGSCSSYDTAIELNINDLPASVQEVVACKVQQDAFPEVGRARSPMDKLVTKSVEELSTIGNTDADVEIISSQLCVSKARSPTREYRGNTKPLSPNVTEVTMDAMTNHLKDSQIGNPTDAQIDDEFYQEMLRRATKDYPFIVPFLRHDAMDKVGYRETQPQDQIGDEGTGRYPSSRQINLEEKGQPSEQFEGHESVSYQKSQEATVRSPVENTDDCRWASKPVLVVGSDRSPQKGIRTITAGSSCSPSKSTAPPSKQVSFKRERDQPQPGKHAPQSPKKRSEHSPIKDTKYQRRSPTKVDGKDLTRSFYQRGQTRRHTSRPLDINPKNIFDPNNTIDQKNLLDSENTNEPKNILEPKSVIGPTNTIEPNSTMEPNYISDQTKSIGPEIAIEPFENINHDQSFADEQKDTHTHTQVNDDLTHDITPRFILNVQSPITSTDQGVKGEINLRHISSCSPLIGLDLDSGWSDDILPLDDLIKVQEQMISEAEALDSLTSTGDTENKRKKIPNPLRKMSTKASRLREVSTLRRDLYSKSPEKREISNLTPQPCPCQTTTKRKLSRKLPAVSQLQGKSAQQHQRPKYSLERGRQITIAKSLQVELKERTVLKTSQLVQQVPKLRPSKLDASEGKSLKTSSRIKQDLKSTSHHENSNKNSKQSSVKSLTAKSVQSVVSSKSLDEKKVVTKRKQKSSTAKNGSKQKSKSLKTHPPKNAGGDANANDKSEPAPPGDELQMSSLAEQDTLQESDPGSVKCLLRKSVLDDVVRQLDMGSYSPLRNNSSSSASETPIVSTGSQTLGLNNVAINIINKYAINISSVSQNVLTEGQPPSTGHENLDRVFGEHASFPLQDFASLVVGERTQ